MSDPAQQHPDPPPVIQLGPLASEPRRKTRHGSENRKRQFGWFVRALPEQEERLKIEAAAAEMSVAAYLLEGRLGPDAAPPPRRRAPCAVPVDIAAVTAAIVAVNRVNNNLNQTAHAANTIALFAEEQGADRLVELIGNLHRSIEKMRGELAVPMAALKAALRYDREG